MARGRRSLQRPCNSPVGTGRAACKRRRLRCKRRSCCPRWRIRQPEHTGVPRTRHPQSSRPAPGRRTSRRGTQLERRWSRTGCRLASGRPGCSHRRPRIPTPRTDPRRRRMEAARRKRRRDRSRRARMRRRRGSLRIAVRASSRRRRCSRLSYRSCRRRNPPTTRGSTSQQRHMQPSLHRRPGSRMRCPHRAAGQADRTRQRTWAALGRASPARRCCHPRERRLRRRRADIVLVLCTSSRRCMGGHPERRRSCTQRPIGRQRAGRGLKTPDR